MEVGGGSRMAVVRGNSGGLRGDEMREFTSLFVGHGDGYCLED